MKEVYLYVWTEGVVNIGVAYFICTLHDLTNSCLCDVSRFISVSSLDSCGLSSPQNA